MSGSEGEVRSGGEVGGGWAGAVVRGGRAGGADFGSGLKAGGRLWPISTAGGVLQGPTDLPADGAEAWQRPHYRRPTDVTVLSEADCGTSLDHAIRSPSSNFACSSRWISTQTPARSQRRRRCQQVLPEP